MKAPSSSVSFILSAFFRAEQLRPVRQLGSGRGSGRRQGEGGQLGPQGFGPEQRLGSNRHRTEPQSAQGKPPNRKPCFGIGDYRPSERGSRWQRRVEGL